MGLVISLRKMRQREKKKKKVFYGIFFLKFDFFIEVWIGVNMRKM